VPWSVRAALVICTALLGGCGTWPHPPSRASELPEVMAGSGIPIGYLAAGQGIDSAALLPPPPAPGSTAQSADVEAHRSLEAMRTPARWALAADDADLLDPGRTLHSFACQLGVEISEVSTPHLFMLLRRSAVDAGLATYPTKRLYQRDRPFVAFNEQTCTPHEEPALAKDGSYPSGHAAIGWLWGLVLAELSPERANALLQRGYDFGESRAICRVHWQTDIAAGRLVAAATYAQLQASPTFRRQRDLARREVAQLRAHAPAGCG